VLPGNAFQYYINFSSIPADVFPLTLARKCTARDGSAEYYFQFASNDNFLRMSSDGVATMSTLNSLIDVNFNSISIREAPLFCVINSRSTQIIDTKHARAFVSFYSIPILAFFEQKECENLMTAIINPIKA
jgi:hypothetical protein